MLTADERAVLWKMAEGWCDGYAYPLSAMTANKGRPPWKLT